MRSHVRRLEALRRAGLVERIDADHWKVPKDIVERGQAYDLSQGGDGLRIRTLSAIGLDRQIASDGATWLDRQIIADDRSEIRDSGFGREVNKAINRRARRLVEMGLATAKDGNIRVPVDTVATLERREVERVGHQMARERGLTYMPANAGEYVSGRLAGVASLVSGRFAMIDNGLGFQLVPWQPLLEKHIGQHISRPSARRRRNRVDLGKKPGAQLVMQPQRSRARQPAQQQLSCPNYLSCPSSRCSPVGS